MSFSCECCKATIQKTIALSEKKSKFILNNPENKTVEQIKFDGSPRYSYSGKRCDFILLLKDLPKEAALFVELKGHKLRTAIQQLEESIQHLNFGNSKNIYAYAVTTRSPLSTTDIQNEKMRLRRKKITFDVKNTQLLKNYSDHL